MARENDIVERQLLSRLRALGLMLLFFGSIAFVGGVFSSPPSPVDTPEEMQQFSGFTLLSADSRINFFGVGAIFFFVGSTCIVLSIKRSKNL